MAVIAMAYFFTMNTLYCKDLTFYKRLETHVVNIGNTPVGGDHPIRIQSMTNTRTCDTFSTVKQILKIAEKGADYVRLTVQGKKEAENIPNIIIELSKMKCNIPLIADIHFNPKLAVITASIVDKVRINPGNYIDKKSFKTIEYTKKEYNAELERLKEQFLLLLSECRKNKTALRIGTNHGSLSDRIMSHYGDTPEGMTESALEFLRICKEENFNNVVVSMKSSNTRIMVYATRLLISKMNKEGMNYPVHLGVTEAGEGEDGRIKSAVGIGTLLADGIGDTIRVSLTEDPEIEIPVAQKMVDYLQLRENHEPIPLFGKNPLNPYSYKKRESDVINNIGGRNTPVVIHSLNGIFNQERLSEIGWHYTKEGSWQFTDLAPDYLFVSQWLVELPPPTNKGIILPGEYHSNEPKNAGCIISYEQIKNHKDCAAGIHFVQLMASQLDTVTIEKLKNIGQIVIVLETDNANGLADQRAAILRMINLQCKIPIILKRTYNESLLEDLQLKSAMDFGCLFIDGLGDGIWIENSDSIEEASIVSISFGILQASRVRISKTEFISCPSCGRTLFDLQTTTKKIRDRTNHLKGLKIGIMGCIVNGPGEMADADYGYVGAGKGRVTLYKEKQIVRKNIPEDEAVDALINLIKENNDWIDPV